MSRWNTPIATPIATPVVVTEPISIILQKQIDVNEKIRQVFSSITSGSRVLSDTSAVVEQFPALLLLLKDASSSWLTVEAAEQLYQLFSIQSPHSITRLLTTKDTTFVFPLSSLPSTIDWSKEFEFFKFLGYSKRNLIDMRAKTMTLDAIDYYFFVLTVLGITDTNQPVASWSGSQSQGSSWGHQAGHWYDTAAHGTIHSRVLLEVLETAISSGRSAPNVSPVLAHKCELSFSTFVDFFCSLSLYSFNNAMVDFSAVFKLVRAVLALAIKTTGVEARAGHPSPSSQYVTKLTKLTTELVDSSNFFAQKFLHKMSPSVWRELAALFRSICLPWELTAETVVGTTSKDGWIKRHADVYSLFVELLTAPRVVEFVAEFKQHSAEPRFSRFIALSETRDMIEGAVDVVAIVSPSTGLVEALPAVFLSPTAVAVVKSLWAVCRSCAWVNNKTPKNLANAAWQMDLIVNSAKATGLEHNEMYRVFTWEAPAEEPELTESEIPKRITYSPLQLTNGVVRAERSWDQPVCASESSLVIFWLRAAVSAATNQDLRHKPSIHAWVRSLASYSSLTVISFTLWMFVSLAICPQMESGARVALVQFFFVLLVGLLAVRWISTQYVV